MEFRLDFERTYDVCRVEQIRRTVAQETGMVLDAQEAEDMFGEKTYSPTRVVADIVDLTEYTVYGTRGIRVVGMAETVELSEQHSMSV